MPAGPGAAPVRVRPATEADLDAILDLLEEVAAEGRWLATEAPVDRDRRRRSMGALITHPAGARAGTVFVADAPPEPTAVSGSQSQPASGSVSGSASGSVSESVSESVSGTESGVAPGSASEPGSDPGTGSESGAESRVSPGAAAGGRIVGSLGLELTPYGVAELGMMVAKDWRRRGVGRALMQAALAWARDAGAHKVALEVWPHNQSARALYRRMGFTEEGYLRAHYPRRNGELWDAVVMGLPLRTDKRPE